MRVSYEHGNAVVYECLDDPLGEDAEDAMKIDGEKAFNGGESHAHDVLTRS